MPAELSFDRNNPADRVRILKEVHNVLTSFTDSLEPYCPTLAYLYVAIAGDGYIFIEDQISASDDRLRALLRNLFTGNHPVWKFIQIAEQETRELIQENEDNNVC